MVTSSFEAFSLGKIALKFFCSAAPTLWRVLAGVDHGERADGLALAAGDVLRERLAVRLDEVLRAHREEAGAAVGGAGGDAEGLGAEEAVGGGGEDLDGARRVAEGQRAEAAAGGAVAPGAL